MRKRFFKTMAALILLFVISLVYTVRQHPYPKDLMSKEWDQSYWGSLKGNSGDLSQKTNQAVQYSKSMVNILYDPLMGKCDDVLGKMGLVVCIDVPVRSYLAAGISFPALLKDSVQKHPEWFKLGPDNYPNSEYFYRRVRNYYDLFQHHPYLEADNKPQVGDWAFYGRFHIAMVVSVGPNGYYELIEGSPEKMRVAPTNGGAMSQTWGQPDFFGRICHSQKISKKMEK